MVASVVISTYNRADALEPTLRKLADQDVDTSDYEVLVVDDGSTDSTQEVLQSLDMPYRLRLFRLEQNSGVSAGRNVGLRNAAGRWIIMLSDDLLVPRNFVSTHATTLERFPGTWVVGGFAQLDDLTATPFGRFLDKLEASFEVARTGRKLEDHVYEMTMPTARNLSLPRSDLDQIGLFDEQFRVTCEDQDLAKRAADAGVRFIYTDAVECIHNDQAADLRRYGRFQQRGARDTVRLVKKYPDLHGNAPVVHVNGPVRGSDTPATIAKKLVKRTLGNERGIALAEIAVRLAEHLHLPDGVLARAYRFVISLYTFRGWREGVRETAGS